MGFTILSEMCGNGPMIFGLHVGIFLKVMRLEGTHLALKMFRVTRFLKVVLLCAMTLTATGIAIPRELLIHQTHQQVISAFGVFYRSLFGFLLGFA